MRIVLAAALLPLAACGGAETAEEVHEERAEQLEEAAEVSTPEGAEQLENLAERHERAADALEETAGERPADPAAATAPIPDEVSVGNETR